MLAPDSAVFDFETLLNNFSGMEDLAFDLMADFRRDSSLMVRRIAGAIEAGDRKEIALASHTLAGVLANLYAARAREAALLIERQALAGELAQITSIFRSLESELKSLDESLAEATRKQAG